MVFRCMNIPIYLSFLLLGELDSFQYWSLINNADARIPAHRLVWARALCLRVKLLDVKVCAYTTLGTDVSQSICVNQGSMRVAISPQPHCTWLCLYFYL